ncbi:insulinase family protein [Flavobacterium amniphilum]|uniref:insulinase family protein n=1 Tax=Flavobacterium amniphilum TaxID=1834035 RepID=UPI00202A5DCB|nr:insulinase family protein [Flavobacterium amniphilum]MCL9806997.1 insulinase family protein [Flavobacterium amniphilum]
MKAKIQDTSASELAKQLRNMKTLLINKNAIILFSSLFFTLTSLQAQNERPMPKPGPVPTVNVGKPQKFTLPNGLKVMVVENHKLPRVSFSLSVDNNPHAEGAKKGVKNLTGELIGKGTKSVSRDVFNDEIDMMGARIDFSADGAYASGLSKYSVRILELMVKGCLEPNFTQDELDKEKIELIEGVKSEEKDVANVASRVEDVLAFGKNHPFGEYLTEQSINAVSLNDVIQYYNTYFVPENAYLVVIGDVKFADIKNRVEKAFENWTKASAPNATYNDPKNVQYTQINFVDMPNAVQSNVSFVNTVSLKMTDKDYFATIIADQIFGGDFGSYLNMNLREKHGWTYGAGSYVNGSKFVTKFTASAKVRNMVTDSAVVELLNELKRIRTEKVTDQVLRDAKAAYIGSFVMKIEKPETVARYALQTETQNLPSDFYENYIKSINAVTADEVMNAAKKYFLADNARIIVVGKGSEVIPALEKTKIPMFFFDKYGNPVEKPVTKKADVKVTVKSVIDNYVNAIGGIKAISEVKTVATFAKGNIQGQQLEFNTKASSKGTFAVDMVLPAMKMTVMKQRINDKVAYIEQQGKKKMIEGEDYKLMKSQAHPFFELYLIDNPQVTFTGIEKVNDVDAYVVKTPKSRLFFDVKTGLKIASENESKQGEQLIKQMIYFDDYKEVKGVKYPFKISIEAGMPIDLVVSDVKVNEGVADSDFQ